LCGGLLNVRVSEPANQQDWRENIALGVKQKYQLVTTTLEKICGTKSRFSLLD
jgi:hypothetical protein